MMTLHARQREILLFIQKQGRVGNQEIKKHLHDVSRITIVRDITTLLRRGLIRRVGKGRSVQYEENISNEMLRYIDPEIYFSIEPDKRSVRFERFSFDLFSHMKDIFSPGEIRELIKKNREYQLHIKKLSSTAQKKEIERLTIELSWKSSQIEGNTYTLLDTELLLKEHQEAKGRKKSEAIMILNHKRALDFIFQNPRYFKMLSVAKIMSIHDLLVNNLGVEKGVRKRPVGIVGTRYRPLGNIHQIREALEKSVHAINTAKDPFSKALLALMLFSYIQPFEDGNKRTSRLIANALLIAYSVCPLSFRSIDEADYKKAIILFYEQHNARFLKELFAEQFRFAVNTYFLA